MSKPVRVQRYTRRRRKTIGGPQVYQKGTHANAYSQWLEYDDGSAINAVTVVVGEGKEATYVDMDPEVARAILKDLQLTLAEGGRVFRSMRAPAEELTPEELQKVHGLRQRYGLDTDSGSRYFALRQRGYSDTLAQYLVFKERGLIV